MSTMRALVLTGPGPRAGPGRGRARAGSGRRRGAGPSGRRVRHGPRTGRRARWRTWPPAARPTPCDPATSGAAWSAPSATAWIPAWIGRRVTGDTMLACGRCDRCLAGRRHVCRELLEVGISDGVAGALAEQLRVPASSLHRLPDTRRRRGRRDGRARRQRLASGRCGARRHRACACSCGVPGTSGCSPPPSPPPPERRSTWSRAGAVAARPCLVVRGQRDVVARSPPRRADPRRHRCDRRPGRAGGGGPARRAGWAGRLHRARRVAQPDRHARPRRSATSPRSGSWAVRPASPTRSSTTPTGGSTRRRWSAGRSAWTTRPASSTDPSGARAARRSRSTRAARRRRRPAALGPLR